MQREAEGWGDHSKRLRDPHKFPSLMGTPVQSRLCGVQQLQGCPAPAAPFGSGRDTPAGGPSPPRLPEDHCLAGVMARLSSAQKCHSLPPGLWCAPSSPDSKLHRHLIHVASGTRGPPRAPGSPAYVQPRARGVWKVTGIVCKRKHCALAVRSALGGERPLTDLEILSL